MLNFKKLLVPAVAALLLSTSCNKELSYEKTPNGLQYHFFEDKEGAKAKTGDMMTFNLIFQCKDTSGKDSVLRNTWKEGQPLQVIVQELSSKGGLEEGLQMLSVGDSVALKLNADSLFLKSFKSPRPAFIDSASFITFTIKVLKIQNREEFEKEQAKMMEERKSKMESEMAGQKVKDDSLIKAYAAQNNLPIKSTPSGLYYVINKKGKGALAKTGDKVVVKYAGRLLNGTVFDPGAEPYEFSLGAQQVIPGWDEGITLLSEGGSGLLLVPSSLGYGPMQMGDKIPPYSVLVFDVELLKIKK